MSELRELSFSGTPGQVRHALGSAADEIDAAREEISIQQAEIDNLRSLLQMWEQRVSCLQCGKRYSERACGPTHAIVASEVQGPDSDDG